MNQDCRGQKIALVAHCLLNQNAKIYGLARYPAQAPGLPELLAKHGYGIYQLPCPEIYAAGINRWGQVKEQYSSHAMKKAYAQAVAFTWDNIADYVGHGYQLVLIGLDGSPSCGVGLTESNPHWGGSLCGPFPKEQIQLIKEPGSFMEMLLHKLKTARPAGVPAIGIPLDVQDGVLDLQVIERFLAEIE